MKKKRSRTKPSNPKEHAIVPPTAAATPSPASPRIPRRQWLYAGGILLGLAVLFLLANSGFFLKQLAHRFNPPVVSEPEPGATDPYLLALAGTPNRLRIPSLGIDAPIVEAAARTQAAYKTALQQGVVHLPETAEPGDIGNAYLFGHSSDLPWAAGDFKNVFALLPEIKRGAKIYASNRDGNAYAFTVGGTRIVRADDLSVLADPGNEKRMLTLQTSYPVGTALRRFVVTAEYAAEILVK
ncbi:MAG: sortase [Patescibacteria group bacterium]|nr:MAG: sortase [Patescibacteria group bacterium]